MTLYYNDVDITDAVTITGATHRDACDGRCDCLDLSFANPSNWYRWDPQPDDRIRLEHKGYDTGDMYVSAILPEKDTYQITAYSMPRRSRLKRWQTYYGRTLRDIVYLCANDAGMDYGIYGPDEKIKYEYLIRKNEGVCAFLSRLCEAEGAVLKCVNGKLTLIGIEYAQGLDAVRGFEIRTTSSGVTYIRRSDNLIQTMIVRTRKGDVRVDDINVSNGITRVNPFGANSFTEARRWAGGLLLSNNRKSQQMTIDLSFDPGITAMQKISVDGDTDMNGDWIVSEVMNDFVQETTAITCYRSTTI